MTRPIASLPRRHTVLLGAVSASALLLAAPVATSSAEPGPAGLVTMCTGTAGPVSVPGDLVVPAGSSCLLQGTTVQGDVDVRAGADLIAEEGAVLEGSVLVRADAYLEVQGATVQGLTELRSSYGAVADQAVLGAVDARASGFFHTDASTQADYNGVNTQTYLQSAWVDGDLTTRRGDYVDIDNSVVTGGVDIRNTVQGSVVCSSEIDGDVVIRGASTGVVQLGEGAFPDCAGNVVGGGVELRANSTADGTLIGANIIRGDLVCAGNDPTPTGHNNRVRGAMVGQCAEMTPAGAALTSSAQSSRGETMMDLIEKRSQNAREQVALAGAAELSQHEG